MPKYETITLQACDNAPFETFNARPLKVNGVTLTPSWPWSNTFRKVVRASYAKVKDNDDRRQDRAEAYQAWYEKKFNREYDGPYVYNW